MEIGKKDSTPRTAERILLLVTQADWGGVQSFLLRFAEDLKAEGKEILLAGGGEGELWARAAQAGIPTQRLKHVVRAIHPWHDLLAVHEIRKLIKNWKPDTVHLNSSKMGVIGGLAAQCSSPRPWVVYRIGGWSFLEPMSRVSQWLYMVAERWSARWKDIIITVHPGDETLARSLNIRPRIRMQTIPNGLDMERFERKLCTRSEARTRLGIPNDVFVFGTIANAYPAKALLPYLDVLDEVLAHEPQRRGVVIGGGPELSLLKRKRESLKTRERILLLGPQNDAPQLYRAFDVFVLSSRKEGMPWSLLEAMAAGIPSIATDVGACRWMLNDLEGHQAGMVVEPQHAAALKHAMQHIAASADERQRMSLAGPALVKARFSWKHTFSQHLSTLDPGREHDQVNS